MRRLAVLLVAVLTVAACSGDDSGGEGGSASTTGAPAATDDTATGTLEVTSTAFAEGDLIPETYAACAIGGGAGDNVSPPLDWSGVPDGTAEVAVTMVDPDAGGFVHWVVAGLDPTSTGLEEGTVPAGAVEALNDTGAAGYFGPCPPTDHTYLLTVHALGEPSGLEAGAPPADAVAAVESASTAIATLSAVYDPNGP
jgi:Raf kinase inhibitor-like YbhB/YbcL family protein